MQEFFDLFDFKEITDLIQSITEFITILTDLVTNIFSWLGEEILIILLIAIPIVIILRIVGR